jgi:hypothetical protein
MAFSAAKWRIPAGRSDLKGAGVGRRKMVGVINAEG